MSGTPHIETCPTCERAVADGSEHESDCPREGQDAATLAEAKESWARDARFDEHRLQERGP